VQELARVVRSGGRIALSMPTGAGDNWSFMGELAMQFAGRATGPPPPRPGPAPDLVGLCLEAGLVNVDVHDETEAFTFADTDTWWQWIWSQGMRAMLESLPDDARADFRAAADERLQSFNNPDGSIPLHQHVRYVTAVAPR
jgi:trans-aconitate methyltransferase